MVQITLVKSREVTVVALVRIQNRPCRAGDLPQCCMTQRLSRSVEIPAGWPSCCLLYTLHLGTCMHLAAARLFGLFHVCLRCVQGTCGAFREPAAVTAASYWRSREREREMRGIELESWRNGMATHCLALAIWASSGVAVQGRVHPALILLVLLVSASRGQQREHNRTKVRGTCSGTILT